MQPLAPPLAISELSARLQSRMGHERESILRERFRTMSYSSSEFQVDKPPRAGQWASGERSPTIAGVAFHILNAEIPKPRRAG